MRYSEMCVSPELAKRWLESNKHNRRLSVSTVMRYAADMKAGQWKLNGEPIQFSEDGELKNGQHRLAAIVMADIPVKMSVIFGVPNDINIYDFQNRRTEANVLQIDGVDLGKNEVSIAKFLFYVVLNRNDIGSGQIIEFARNEAESLCGARKMIGGGGRGTNVMRKASCYAAAWVMLKNGYDSEQMKRFFKVGETGYYSDGEEAAVVLRNMIIAKKLPASHRSERIKLFKTTCKALMDFADKKARKVVYRDFEIDGIDCLSGSNAELILRQYLT